MGSLGLLLAAGLAALLIVLIGVLAVPYYVTVLADVGAGTRVQLSLRPLSRRGPRILAITSPFGAADAGPEDAKSAPRRRARLPNVDPQRVFFAAAALLASVLSAFRLVSLRIVGKVGLGDPADTGALFGLLMPVNYAPLGPRIAVDLRPGFDGPVVEGSAELVMRVVPLRLLRAAAVFAWRVFLAPP